MKPKELNKKQPILFYIGLCTLCLVLITTHMTGGLFARYTASANGSDSARVAKFGCNVYYTPKDYQNLSLNVSKSAIYTFVDEFRVTNGGEVSFSYNLSLRLSAYTASVTYQNPATLSHGSLAAPTKANSTALSIIQRQGNSVNGEIVNLNFASTFGGQTYVAGKIYYGFSDDGINYTWYNNATKASNNPETATLPSRDLSVGGTHYYKVLYFIDLSVTDNNFTLPQSALLYSIHCTQID